MIARESGARVGAIARIEGEGKFLRHMDMMIDSTLTQINGILFLVCPK